MNNNASYIHVSTIIPYYTTTALYLDNENTATQTAAARLRAQWTANIGGYRRRAYCCIRYSPIMMHTKTILLSLCSFGCVCPCVCVRLCCVLCVDGCFFFFMITLIPRGTVIFWTVEIVEMFDAWPAPPPRVCARIHGYSSSRSGGKCNVVMWQNSAWWWCCRWVYRYVCMYVCMICIMYMILCTSPLLLLENMNVCIMLMNRNNSRCIYSYCRVWSSHACVHQVSRSEVYYCLLLYHMYIYMYIYHIYIYIRESTRVQWALSSVSYLSPHVQQ